MYFVTYSVYRELRN